MKNILLTGIMCFAVVTIAIAQRTVSGVVTSSEDNMGIPGVNVLLKGTTTGTTTDFDGRYRIEVPEDGGTLVVSFIGMQAKEVEVGSRSVIDVELDPDVQELTEVVVTALGISRQKRALGYSVQEVEGDEVAKSRETNIVNGLQGQIAGVQIQGSTSGAVGGTSRITIRGANSFTQNNQPLFVVDGIPVDNSNFASTSQATGFGTGSGQYDYGNTVSDINPADIESINVLKGAAASALYGVRGANGVILITTKSGQGKKGIGVSVNSAVTIDRAAQLIPHQQVYGGGSLASTPSGFTEFTQDGTSYLAPAYGKDGSWGPKYDPNVMVRHWDSWDENADNYKETRPWVAPDNDYEEFFETGVTWTNTVALEGGNDQGNFRLSYTNVNQDGVLPESGLDRNTFAISLNYALTDRLNASASANYVKQNANGRAITGYNNGNPMQAFTQWWQVQLDVDRLQDNYLKEDGTQYTWNPIGLSLDEDNDFISFNPRPTFFDNPYFTRNEFLQEDTRDRIFGFFELSYQLADYLTLAGKAMRDGYTFQAREGIPIGSVDQPEYSETTRTFEETNFDLRLMFNKQFDRWSIDAIVGGNRMAQVRKYTKVSTTGGLTLPGFYHLSNSVGDLVYDVSSVRPARLDYKINSVYFTGSVGYNSMFFLDLAYRLDWASTLPEAENPFDYYSVTGSFVFSELPFLVNSDVISFGKLRAAYGTAANAPQPYQLMNTYTPVTPNYGNFARYEVLDASNNPDLGPETTREFEVGLETNFFNGRINLDVAYYDRTTEDQIFNVDVSRASGYTAAIVNAGSMRNSGWEFMFSAIPIQYENFEWQINANLATYNNEVVELAEGIQSLNMGSTWAATLRVQEGLPYMAIFGQDWQRNDDGEVLVDGDGFPSPTSDQVYLGSAIADFTGGVKNTFRFYGVSVGALLDFQKGGTIHSTSLQWAKYSGMMEETVYQDGRDIRQEGYIVEGVTESGEPNSTPVDAQTYYQNYFNVATPNLYDASFLKLREVSISYSLPNSVLANTPFNDISFGVFGRNLAILAADLPHLDPQIVTSGGNVQGLENAQVPSTRSYGFNLGFKF